MAGMWRATMLEGGGLMLTKKLLLVLPVILFFCITSQVKADDTLRSLMNLNPEFSKSHNTIFPQYLNDEDVTIPVGDLCYMNGGKLYYCFNDTSFTYELDGAGALANSDWYYIYLDISTITNWETSLVTGNLSRSTTAPTYDADKGGYYSTDDLCIGFVYTDGSGDIRAYSVFNNRYQFDAHITEQSGISPDSWTAYTLVSIPLGNVTVYYEFSHQRQGGTPQNSYIYLSPDGSAGHFYFCFVNNNMAWSRDFAEMQVNSSKQIYVKLGTAGTNLIIMLVTGFEIPSKMLNQ